MAALSGEPWRGAARADHYVTATPANFRRAWVTLEAGSPLPTGDLTTWKGAPGAAFTLRFKWTEGGTPAGTAPTFATVEARTPGSSIIGDAWTVAFPAANTEVTRAIHLDANPMNANPDGSIFCGMVELRLIWGNAGGITPWSADSRGGGTPAALNSVDNARGKIRAHVPLADLSLSDIALAGAEPASWGATNPVFARLATRSAAPLYRPIATTLELKRPNDGVVERSQLSSSSNNATRDYSWTATTGSGAARIAPLGMHLASEAKDIQFTLPTQDFGGDNEYVFEATDLPAGWVFDSELQIRYPARITVDPRLFGAHHLQVNRASFAVAFNEPSKTFLAAYAGEAATRVLNARGQGLDGLSYTQTADPNNTGSTETESAVTATRDGQAGWSALISVCKNGKPGGTWIKRMDVTLPADMAPDAAFINPDDTIVALVDDPGLSVDIDGGDPSAPKDHWRSGRPFIAGIAASRFEGLPGAQAATRVAYDAGSARFYLASFNPTLYRLESLAADGETWEYATTPALWTPVISPGDSMVGLYEFVRAKTAKWGNRGKIFIKGYATVAGVQKICKGSVDQLGPERLHSDGGMEWADVPP